MAQQQQVATLELEGLTVGYGGNSGLAGHKSFLRANQLRRVFLRMGRNPNTSELHLGFRDEEGALWEISLREVDGKWFIYGGHPGEGRMNLPTKLEFQAAVLDLPEAQERLALSSA